LLRRCVEVRRQVLPEGHWQVAEAQSLLGACLTARQEYEDAEEHLLHSVDVLRASRGPADEHTRTAIRRLGELYEAWGRPQEAAKYRATAP
jgi:serine/threonine-protein kinase